MKTKSKIRWKFLRRINTYEGYVNDKLSFSIEGTLCVSDVRNCYGEGYVVPNRYRIQDVNHGKQIAIDLLEGNNTEKHEENRLKWVAEQDKCTKLIHDTDLLIKQLTEL
jgi:hypothetical protein